MAKRGRKKKPLVDTEITCPKCKAALDVKIYRTRTNPADPAEYEYDQQVQLKFTQSEPGSVTMSSGGRSVTLTKKTAENIDKMLAKEKDAE